MALPAEGAAELATRVSDWERQGSDDELGTLQPDQPGHGDAARPRCGQESGSASRCLFTPTESRAGFVPGRINPLRTMVMLDTTPPGENGTLGPTMTSSSWVCRPARTADGIAHVSYDGQLYNGYPASDRDGRRRCDTMWHREGRVGGDQGHSAGRGSGERVGQARAWLWHHPGGPRRRPRADRVDR